MENVTLMLLVCQLHQTPEAQQLGPCGRGPESIYRDMGTDFLPDTATAILQGGLAVAHTRLQGQNPKGSSGNQIIPQISWGQVYQKKWSLFALGLFALMIRPVLHNSPSTDYTLPLG